MSEFVRDWLSIGRKFNEDAATKDRRGRTADDFQAAVEKQVASLRWEAPVDGVISGAMSPVLAIQAVIEQMELRRVTMFALHSDDALYYPDGPETAYYSLLGVEVTNSKQKFRLHLLDTGLGCTPMCIDWYEGKPGEPDCAEFRENGTCIHSDHMAQAGL